MQNAVVLAEGRYFIYGVLGMMGCLLMLDQRVFAEADCAFVQKTAADFAELQKLYEKTPKVLSLEIDKRMKQQTSLLGEQNPYLACIYLAADYYKTMQKESLGLAVAKTEIERTLLKEHYGKCASSGCNRDEKFLGNYKLILDRTCTEIQSSCEEFKYEPAMTTPQPLLESFEKALRDQKPLPKQKLRLGVALIVVGSLAMVAGAIFTIHSVKPIFTTPTGCPSAGFDNSCAFSRQASIGLSVISFTAGGAGIIAGGLILGKQI